MLRLKSAKILCELFWYIGAYLVIYVVIERSTPTSYLILYRIVNATLLINCGTSQIIGTLSCVIHLVTGKFSCGTYTFGYRIVSGTLLISYRFPKIKTLIVFLRSFYLLLIRDRLTLRLLCLILCLSCCFYRQRLNRIHVLSMMNIPNCQHHRCANASFLQITIRKHLHHFKLFYSWV